jgi:hypothetical protein
MEEMEISSWTTLDVLKEAAEVVETVGDLQSGHWKSIFCVIEDDYLELGYVDTVTNFLRRFEDKDEFELAIERRREEGGETRFDDDEEFDEDFEEDSDEEDYDDDSETF